MFHCMASVTLHYYCIAKSPQLQLNDGSGVVVPPVSPPCDSIAQRQCLTFSVSTSTTSVFLQVLRIHNTIYISEVKFIAGQPSVDLCVERQVGKLFHWIKVWPLWLYVWRRLAFVGLLVPLTSKSLFSFSIHGITLSVDAVDSVLMLQVAPTESSFSTDPRHPSLPRKLQRSAPSRAR